MAKIPECCKGCIKWEKFGKNCWVYWDLKKECTQRVEKVEDLDLQQNL